MSDGGRSEDLERHHEPEADDDADEATGSGQPDTNRPDVIPFDKESRLSDAPTQEEESAG